LKAWAAYLPSSTTSGVSLPLSISEGPAMAPSRSSLSAIALGLAGAALTASPLAAAELPSGPVIGPIAYDSPIVTGVEDAQSYRRYHRHRDRINAGDVIAGVAVIGVLAAIASSASRNRDDDYREGDYRQGRRPDPYREPAPRGRSWQGSGIDGAVDLCVGELERGRDRVASVDQAARDAGGWRVSGSLGSGEGFACRIDNEGRIRAIDIGEDLARLGSAAAQPGEQLSDEYYARARAALRDSPRQYQVDGDLASPPATDEPCPAYPGGPLPGEEGYDESWGG
jgi:hypothetical protein